MKRFADPGNTIRVEAGESFAIELAGNPTTGYLWEANVDDQYLELLFQEFESRGESVGAGGAKPLGGGGGSGAAGARVES